MVKVAVLGAAGGIGQPLSLLLKQNLLITELALYDIVNVPGVAVDLSHINTPSKVTSKVGEAGLPEILTGASVVVIPAGIPRKPGMSRDDLFKINAGIVRDLANASAKYCPKAFILIISNPVNSTVPIVSEVFKKHGVYDPKRIFGITSLDVVRASTFVSEVKPELDPLSTKVTVIGGHSGVTIIPLLSQLKPTSPFTEAELETLTKRIQFGGDEVVKAKDGAGSATLSMAFAGARFTIALLEAAFEGKSGVIGPSYVALESDPQGGQEVRSATTGLDYFATNVELGPEGIKKIHSLDNLSSYEKKLLDAAIPELKQNITKGKEFVQSN